MVSGSALLITTFDSCGNNEATWKQIVSFFKKDKLSIAEMRQQLSDKAITAIVNVDTMNNVEKVRKFFYELSSRHDYSFESSDSILYIMFNRKDKIAGGPTIEVKHTTSKWYITDVRFGK